MPVGRPPKYKTPEELQEVADKYFDECDDRDKPYTIGGLNYYLGFEDVDSLAYQGTREGFSRTTKRIRLRIEARKNEMLFSPAVKTAGVIFDLKNNHGWVDRKEIGVDEKTSPNIDRIEERLEELETKSSLHSKKLN